MRRFPGAWLFVPMLLLVTNLRAEDWPQWMGPQRDGVWRETGILDTFPKEGPKLRWRTPVALGYAGPAIANGRVYVTDWLPNPETKVPASGFSSAQLGGQERVHCLDEKTGKILWTHAHPCTYQVGYPGGPRTTPLIAGGKVYTLGTMGDLLCLEEATGQKLWSHQFQKEYNAPIQIWGFSASPLLDGDKLICLVGGDATVVAFHKDTGKELWRSLEAKSQGYCPPVIYTIGGTRHLVIWHASAVNGLDPETGKVFWSIPWEIKAALSIPMPRQDGNRLFVTSFYNSCKMIEIDPVQKSAKIAWEGKSNSEQSRLTASLHSIMPTPLLEKGHIYGVCSYGQLRCLDAATGKRIWETFKATSGKEERWANAFLTPQGDRTFLFNDNGDLIIAKLSPTGYEELSRAHLIKPTNTMANNRPVVWVHPAYGNRSIVIRNDKEIVSYSLAKE